MLFLIQTTFKFEARSSWWLEKFQALDGFRRSMTIEKPAVEEGSKALTEFLQTHDKKDSGLR